MTVERRPQLVIVGSINRDYVLQVDRLPFAGETVSGRELVVADGGKGANAGVVASRLGARTVIVAAVGDDEEGRQAVESLRSAGVGISLIVLTSQPTGAALVLIGKGGENQIAVAPGANSALRPEAVRDAITNQLPDAVLANLEVSDAVVQAAAEAALQIGASFILDPAPARPLSQNLIAMCSVLTPNIHEALKLGYASVDELLSAGAGAVVITQGGLGVEIHRPGQPSAHIDAFPVTPLDTVGAGDAFAAGVAVGLAENRNNLQRAVLLGSAAGALSTLGVGARGAEFDRHDADQLISDAGQLLNTPHALDEQSMPPSIPRSSE